MLSIQFVPVLYVYIIYIRILRSINKQCSSLDYDTFKISRCSYNLLLFASMFVGVGARRMVQGGMLPIHVEAQI